MRGGFVAAAKSLTRVLGLVLISPLLICGGVLGLAVAVVTILASIAVVGFMGVFAPFVSAFFAALKNPKAKGSINA